MTFVITLSPEATALLLSLWDMEIASLMSLQLIHIDANVIQSTDQTMGPFSPRPFTTCSNLQFCGFELVSEGNEADVSMLCLWAWVCSLPHQEIVNPLADFN